MNNKLKIKKINEIDKKLLEEIYVKSEFIDPINEILFRIENQANGPKSEPFLVMEKNGIVSFFTIESSNPNILNAKVPKGYWLESFFITKKYLGRGYAKGVVNLLLKNMKTFYPESSSLNLTVNFRNEVAQQLYKKCGFIDTFEIYSEGPAGPQYIYTTPLKGC